MPTALRTPRTEESLRPLNVSRCLGVRPPDPGPRRGTLGRVGRAGAAPRAYQRIESTISSTMSPSLSMPWDFER